MKKLNMKIAGALIALAVLFGSCEKWIDPDMNINPNSPDDVTMNLILPSVQASLGYVIGGDHSRMSAIWMQHLSGVNRQSFALENYTVLESDANNLWNTLYVGPMNNLQILMTKAEEEEAFYYLGVAQVLTAFTVSTITDVWGDAPYSEALLGLEGNTTPTYDTQEELYATINGLLDSGIENLGKPAVVGIPVPNAISDLFYRGSTANWVKLAKALKVRTALHLSKRNGMAPVRALIDAGGLLAANADDFQFNFGVTTSENNPRFQFDAQRGDIRVGQRIVDLMNAVNDPRLPRYFSAVGGAYVGSGPGEGNGEASMAGPGYAANNAPVYLFTFMEQKFIEAEAFFGTDNDRAATAYNDGVKASLAKHGVTDVTWEEANANETAATITLEKIMTGKYVALFMSSETWVDWRRTGLPALTAPAAATIATPRRYLYTVDERSYNGANVPTGITPVSRLWWDTE